MYELALFAGAGGGILAGKLLGWQTVCAVEIDAYAASVLMQRQNDGILAPFPVWDDIRTFDGRPWRGRVDVVSGGFPCQDISCAGKGEGITGKRSGLWSEMARILGEILPPYVFVENSPMLVRRGLDRVLCDLANMGYNAQWGTLGGSYVGNVADGKRLWLIALSPDCPVLEGVDLQEYLTPCTEESCRRQRARAIRAALRQDDYGQVKRDPYAVACQMDRLKAIGNGQHPVLAASAWRVLKGR